MIKGKYLIIGHMWLCSPMVGEGIREAEVVGSNPSNAGKNRTRAKNHETCERAGKKKIFFKFLFTLQIFILAHKRMMPVTYVLT